MGCFVNVKSILEPFTDTIVGDDGYVRLVDARNRVAGQITSKGIEQELDLGRQTADTHSAKI